MQRQSGQQQSGMLSTGIRGLDDVLLGGLQPERAYLLEGTPGSGKTTMALQFLLAGHARGETPLLITLSESERELQAVAASHGFDLAGIRILDVVPSDEAVAADASLSMFHPSDVELSETLKVVFAEVERTRPARVVIDSLSELRLLAGNPLRYRRQLLAMKRFFGRMGAATIFIDDLTGDPHDTHLHSIAHGVISLHCEVPLYGALRRRLQVAKMRSRAFREGLHDFVIRRGGVTVFPRLVAAEHRQDGSQSVLASGAAGLDALLGGGLLYGTSTLVIGAAGTGKSSIAAKFAIEASVRGSHAAAFLFDESIGTFLKRSSGLDMPARDMVEAGRLSLAQVDPAELSPGEFVHRVRQSVEEGGARVVVIDSLNGYLNAMPNEKFLMLQLHELLSYLASRDVATLLVLTQHGLVGDSLVPIDASYLADTVILLRYFEALGEVRKAISVIKRRTGHHERTIRELAFGPGLRIGEPVREFQGVLTGAPHLVQASPRAAG